MNRRGFVVSMLVVVVCWGLNYVISKIGVRQLDPATFAFGRFLGTTIVTLPWIFRERPRTGLEWLKVLLLGLFGVSLYQWLFTSALQKATAANVAFIFDLAPLFTLMAGRLLHVREASKAMFAGAAISLAGVGCLVGASASGTVMGDLFAGLATVAWSLFTLMTDIFQVPLRGVALTGWMSLFGTMGLLPFANIGALVTAGSGTLLALAYTVVFVTIVGLSLWQNAVMSVGGSKASLYLYLIPVVAALSGWMILGESLTVVQGVGALFILGGVLTAENLLPVASLRRRTQPTVSHHLKG